jgi:hypothetical protein
MSVMNYMRCNFVTDKEPLNNIKIKQNDKTNKQNDKIKIEMETNKITQIKYGLLKTEGVSRVS